MADVVDLKRPDPQGPFVTGSTVALKGGGVIMTVRKPGARSVIVDWTDAQDNLCSAEFPPAMLCHADPEEAEAQPEEAKLCRC